jgi:ribose transport system permease protein
MGLYYELDAIAAVVIGGTSMSGGRGRIWTTVVGVLLLGLITNMLVTSGLSVYWQGAVKGVIILLAVLIQRGQSD